MYVVLARLRCKDVDNIVLVQYTTRENIITSGDNVYVAGAERAVLSITSFIRHKLCGLS